MVSTFQRRLFRERGGACCRVFVQRLSPGVAILPCVLVRSMSRRHMLPFCSETERAQLQNTVSEVFAHGTLQLTQTTHTMRFAMTGTPDGMIALQSSTQSVVNSQDW